VSLRLVAYIRVSTEEQAREGLSLGVQGARTSSYPSVYPEAEIVACCMDSASGKSLSRPGLRLALELLEQGEADGLLVVALDRLTRSVKDVGWLLEGPLKGKALISMQERLDSTTASGELVLNVLVSVAQWERKRNGERVREVMRAKGRLGGRAPYGYHWQVGDEKGDSVLVPDEAEQKWLIWMKDRKTFDHMPAAAIARGLNEQGVPARGGGAWHDTHVRRILKRARKDSQTSEDGMTIYIGSHMRLRLRTVDTISGLKTILLELAREAGCPADDKVLISTEDLIFRLSEHQPVDSAVRECCSLAEQALARIVRQA